MDTVAVVGLGYVGLPLAVAFGKQRATIGFDLDDRKIANYRNGIDPTGEVESADLKAVTQLEFTSDPARLKDARMIVVAVPTPIDLTIYYNIALVYFFAHQFGDALTWINEILSHPKADTRREVQHTAHILQLAVHFELGNNDLLDNLHRSAYRNLKNADELQLFERLLLTNFKKLAGVNEYDRKAVRTYFENFDQELNELLAEFPQQHLLGWFEIQTWLSSKLSGKPMSEVLAQKE